MFNYAHQRKWLLGIIGASLLLGGCVTVPDSVKGHSATPQQNFVSVHNTPELFIGQEARFGGRVVAVKNEPGQTRLEIANMPLTESAKPILGAPSNGRFVAYVNQFLEPVDYQGRFITLVGNLAASESGKIGSVPYDFVVLKATGLQRWNISQQIIYPMGPPIWFGPGFYPRHHYRGYGPGWGMGWAGYNYGYGPAQVQTILTE